MNKEPTSRYLWMVCLVAAMGGLLFGYDWVVIGGAKPFYEPYFNLTGDEQTWWAGWAASSALVGCLAGAVLSAFVTDGLGRKRVLIAAAAMFTASAAWTALAADFTAFIAARILGGIGIGLASTVSPLYIAEVSPTKQRGLFVAINQLTIVIGVLAAQLANYGISLIEPVAENASVAELLTSWNGQQGWRWMFAAELIPATTFFLLSLVIPESPSWLLSRGRSQQALAILTRLGGEEHARQRSERHRESQTKAAAPMTTSELLSPPLLGLLAFGVFLAVFQQWCGTNVLFLYAADIFKSAGFGINAQLSNIVITGVVNLVFTFVAMGCVDRLGRRPLMLLGAGGLALVHLLLGASFYGGLEGTAVLVLVLAAIACYAMTLAPITWVLLAEIFPLRARGAAMSLCVAGLWIGNFFVAQTFPPIKTSLGIAGAFWLYGAVCAVGFVVLYRLAPETKGQSLEDLERRLAGADPLVNR